jgi:hypothetical protein
VPTTVEPGGIAAACMPRGSWPGRKFRSPNSSDRDVASPYRPLAASDTQDSSLNQRTWCHAPCPLWVSG